MSSHSGTIGRSSGRSISGSGNHIRRQRSVEWHHAHGYSSSDEDERGIRGTINPSFDSQLLAQLIAQSQELSNKCKYRIYIQKKIFISFMLFKLLESKKGILKSMRHKIANIFNLYNKKAFNIRETSFFGLLDYFMTCDRLHEKALNFIILGIGRMCSIRMVVLNVFIHEKHVLNMYFEICFFFFVFCMLRYFIKFM